MPNPSKISTLRGMQIEQAKLYFIPKKREFLKIQPGTCDNLLPEDIAEGYTDYVLWSTFKPECLDIDGELEMECLDSEMVLIREDTLDSRSESGMTADPDLRQGDVLKDVQEQAYGEGSLDMQLLLEN